MKELTAYVHIVELGPAFTQCTNMHDRLIELELIRSKSSGLILTEFPYVHCTDVECLVFKKKRNWCLTL